MRRGEAIGPRRADEDLASYRTGPRRSHVEGLDGHSSADDVADPIGLPRGAYQHMVTELQDLLDRLVRLLWAPQYERVN